MATLQFLRYIENDDISTIAFKEFYGSPVDLYPTYSICFGSDSGDIFDNEQLKNNLDANDFFFYYYDLS